MNIDRRMDLLKDALAEIPNLHKLVYDNAEFRLWKDKVSDILKDTFGGDSDEYRRFRPNVVTISTTYTTDDQLQKRYVSNLKDYEIALKSIIQKNEILGKPPEPKTTSEPETTKVFIAHGGKTEALAKLQSLVTALGVIPLMAEEEASEGRSVDQQVEWCLNNGDCAIILGTADDRDLKDGKLYPRRNVHIEIGRIQEKLPGKVIYLLEEGASFPSNISEKVYERFTQANMEKAFLKIVKELRAFGIIKTVTIRK